MKLTITQNKKNILLNRSELAGMIELEGGATPCNNDLVLELAQGKDAVLVVVKKIKTNYGGVKAFFNAVIYDSAADKNNVEQQTKHQRKLAEEASKTAAAESASQ